MANSDIDHNVRALPIPPEILIHVIEYIIYGHTNSIVAVLSVCHLFYDIGRTILHKDLAFTSLFQFHHFTQVISRRIPSRAKPYFACAPRTLTLESAGGTSWVIESDSTPVGIWDLLLKAAQGVIRQTQSPEPQARLEVDWIRLRLHSHTQDIGETIYKALCTLNARSFTWTGPDPPHHFSHAIVRHAVPFLFLALRTYSQLTHLKLTNVHFPDVHDGHPFSIPLIPTLQEFYLGQSTFLPAPTITQFILKCLYPGLAPEAGEASQDVVTPHNPVTIRQIRLVDVYEGSIWGNRLRMPQILRATRDILEVKLLVFPRAPLLSIGEVQEAVMNLVRVEVETERIEGGDRGD
ncbi:hypothetical protein PM082_008030 [Marasmius tenuissimus]|nr:hypothetical protein PM082_008030 [Marasmius tenuissimus]